MGARSHKGKLPLQSRLCRDEGKRRCFMLLWTFSLRSVAICIVDRNGKVRLERSHPTCLVRCLREFGELIHQGWKPARSLNI
ncbi:hypothetical protein RGR602_CH03984 [Rhizobium gallicum bv. gallicum R602sp]|uniref:Uncharacterized protein n=1 Tax=Rhizobium gallicum bv. gallicum R602sp TaxID=1041138 RepID=A0A0B4X7W9_9HYPH|nr:hypothetical protein RGR602_CH03984 [Rhizobium gallicum bv. gallicum R602sp]